MQENREHVMAVQHDIEALRGEMTRAANWVWGHWPSSLPTPSLVVDGRGVVVEAASTSLRQLHQCEAAMCDDQVTVEARHDEPRMVRATRRFGDRVAVEAVHDLGVAS